MNAPVSRVDGVAMRPMGEAAVLLEFPDAEATLGAYLGLRAARDEAVVRDVLHRAPMPHDGAARAVSDIVPAARTVLVAFDRGAATAASAGAWVREVVSRDGSRDTGSEVVADAVAAPVVELAVRYDGDDLDDVAEMRGLAREELIALHTATIWTAAFVGFTPGFAYLDGGDDRLDVPRRASPRPIVPAGSVALAAGYCGVYPRESPGGWQLIGSTDAALWDSARPEPALLGPGTRVRFIRVV